MRADLRKGGDRLTEDEIAKVKALCSGRRRECAKEMGVGDITLQNLLDRGFCLKDSVERVRAWMRERIAQRHSARKE